MAKLLKTGFVVLMVLTVIGLIGCSNGSSSGGGGGDSAYQFIGSINSDVYHYPSCHYVEQINPENKIYFIDSQDAINHGYRPCKVCNPP